MQNSQSRSNVSSSLLGILLSLLVGCGGVSSNTNETPVSPDEGIEESVSTDPNHPTGNTAVILGSSFTDPVGTLNLVPITEPREATLNVQTTHSDAIVRSFDNILYVVNRLGADNIQIVDASDFTVTAQFSTGAGTNPQQILLASGRRGYVTLYQPEDNTSADVDADDLLIINPEEGVITGSIDLTPFTADDGERLARASAMVLVDNQLFVGLQDIPGDFSPPNQPGKIVAVNTATHALTGSLELKGRNPVAMDYSPVTKRIYVAEADYADLTNSNGGVEIVNPETLESRPFIDDLDLGGAPGEIEVGKSLGFVTVGFFDEDFNFITKVISFPLNADDPDTTPALTEVYRSAGFIQDIAVDENGLLLVGDRDPEVNGILFVDPETATVVGGPINTGAAPSSITFIER